MRQRVHGGLPVLCQKTPDARGETSSEINITPVAFNLNQNSTVCLPLVSDDNRLIWVPSHQINLEMDGAAELDKAFDRFPYLTQNQTDALAQRCSLHPDQVKVWFMVQRLRYGISWDDKDICEAQRKFKSSLGMEELQKDRGENKKCNGEVKKSGGKKRGEVNEGQNATEGRMIGENVRANEREVEELEEDKRNTQKKQKRITVADKMGKKRRVDKGFVERAGQPDNQTPNMQRTPMFSGFEEKTKVETKLKEELTNPNGAVTDVKLKAPMDVTVNPAVADGCTRTCRRTKTKTQLVMLKQSFLRCQYPDSEGYSHLMMLTGVPRCDLVQWFGDMRYYLRKRKPGWMNQEQHCQVLANIKYRQCLQALTKGHPRKGGGKAACKMKLERSESRGEDESTQVPRE